MESITPTQDAIPTIPTLRMILRLTKQAAWVAMGLHLKWPMASLSPRIKHPIPNTAPPCWVEGAEILITSHTIHTTDSQVHRRAHAPIPTG